MKYPCTFRLFRKSLLTKKLKSPIFQLEQTFERFPKNVVEAFTKSIDGLTSCNSQKISFYILLLALITVIPASPVFSANVSVTWNKNTESDLAGYKIYKRTLPSLDFGQPTFSGMPSNPSSPSTTVTGLSEGKTYGFIATAFDTSGNESAPSAEKQITVPTGTPPPPSSLNISNLTVASGKTYVVPSSGLQAGGTVYIDRSYTYTTVPTLVQGATYIQTANNDKAATNTNFLSFTVNQSVSVYVAHGDRITPKPAWLNTFTDTGTNLVTSDTTLSLFVRTFSAGTITLGGNVSSANAGNSLSMYSVIVKPDSGSPTDTTAPTVTLTAPSAGTVSGTVTVTASASDNVGVAGVQFRLQGANLGAEDTTSPYSTSWNTTTVPNGSYTLTAIARDAAGNTTTAAPRTVTVSNTSTPPPPSTSSIQVNFQPANATVPSGYQKDDGSVYTSSRGYGWTNGGNTMRERNTNSDQRLDTFVQLKPEEANTWRYDMPNGNYTITLVSGDPDYALSPQRVTVEGKVVIDNLGTSTPNTFITITDVPITIADGALTITLGPSSSNSKLNYVQVKSSNTQ